MSPEPPLLPEAVQLGRAIRFAFVMFILAISYLPVRATLAVPAFEGIFRDMLNGKELPMLTVFVIKVRLLLVVISLLVPLLAIGTLFTRRLVASFYFLGGLCIVSVVLSLLVYHGLSSPLYEIIQTMHGTP